MALVIGLAVGIGIALILVLFFFNRSRRLKDRFGPEYSRAIAETGDRWKAESALQHRKKRVDSLHIRTLDSVQREEFQNAWRSIQVQFIDDPNGTVVEANRLIESVLLAEGYPVADFEQRAADISVEHPTVVENYRGGHQIVLRHAKGHATTEDLRKAMLHFRTLFEDLLGQPEYTQTGRILS